MERQHMELKKDMSKSKIAWEKERELLMQKISQLETQISDYQDREGRLKSSQAGLMNTLANMNNDDHSKKTQELIHGLTEEVKQIKASVMSQDHYGSVFDRVSMSDNRSQLNERSKDQVTAKAGITLNELSSPNDRAKSDCNYSRVVNMRQNALPCQPNFVAEGPNTCHKQETVSFGYELTQGNRFSNSSTHFKTNLEGLKMRQPNFYRSEYNMNIEETLDDSAEEKLHLEGATHKSGVSHLINPRGTTDDRISFDSSQDNERGSSSCTDNGGFRKLDDKCAIQEGTHATNHQHDSLRQESSKVNPMSSNMFGSRQMSLGQSKLDFAGRVESCQVEINQCEDSSAFRDQGSHSQEENNRYFIKKGLSSQHRDFADQVQEETTRRQLINQPTGIGGSRANDQTTYVNIGREEDYSDKTHEKHLNKKSMSNSSSIYRPTSKPMDHRRDIYEVPNSQSNVRIQYDYVDADASQMMYSSKYISNPFKESIQERPTSNRTHKASRRESKQNSVQGFQSGSKCWFEKPPQFRLNIEGMQAKSRRNYEEKYLDNTENFHSNSYISGNSISMTPKDCTRSFYTQAPYHHQYNHVPEVPRKKKAPAAPKNKTKQTKGLTRKDVVEILKLHTKLQSKIQKLEGSMYK